MRRGALLLVMSIAAIAAFAAERVIEGRVVRVVDGDTIDVLHEGAPVRIRLFGIDAPEQGEPWSQRAKQALAERVAGKEVRVIEVDTDRYGRTVGEVYADDVCVGCELVREGHARVYRRFTRDPVLLRLEADAKANRRGLWGLKPDEPKDAAPADRARSCGAKTYCREMVDCAEARFHLEECGLGRLDGDGDGVPCETLCRRGR